MACKLNPQYIEPSLTLTSELRKDVSQTSHWDRGITSWEGCHYRYLNSKIFPLRKFKNLSTVGWVLLDRNPMTFIVCSQSMIQGRGFSFSLACVGLYHPILGTSPHIPCMFCMAPGLIRSCLCFAFLSISTLSISKLCHKNTAWPASSVCPKSIIATSVGALVICSFPSGARLTQLSSRIWRTVMRFDLQCLMFWIT